MKINTVALAGDTEDEIGELITWAHGLDTDLSLIETMPLGDTGEEVKRGGEKRRIP